jgi:hypothetical protein
MSLTTDMKRLIKAARRRGWGDVLASKRRQHYVLRWKDGSIITAGLSPSDHRSILNTKADMKRAEEGRAPVDRRKK